MSDQELGVWRGLVRARAAREGLGARAGREAGGGRAGRGRRELSEDVVEELSCHLAEVYASGLREGLTEAQARQGAVDALEALPAASFCALAEPSRDRGAWVGALDQPFAGRFGAGLAGVVRDVRLAVRQLRRSPGFTVTALLTLAIGIGANTAVFTLVHAVLLRSLPVAHAGQLYALGGQYECCPRETLQGSWSIFSYPFYEEIRDSGEFESLAAMENMRPALSVRRAADAGADGGAAGVGAGRGVGPGGDGVAESFTGEFVSGNYFTTLGVQALAGRLFDVVDDRKGAAPVAVASYAAWQRYGFDASLIGRPLVINGVSMTLVGVTPPAFYGDRLERRPPDFWMPLAIEPALTREGSLLEEPVAGWLSLIGRLRPGVQPAQAQTQLTTALRHYLRVPGHLNRQEDLPKVDAQVIQVVPGGGGINAMKDAYQQGLSLLFAASVGVLLIACANLANLLLARGAMQRVRAAVELAMGASRWQILRRHVTESVVLALAGGVAGLVTAIYASRLILLIAFRGAAQVPISATPSMAVLGFTFVVSLITGVLFGVGPAWLASRSDPAEALRGASRVVSDAALPQRSLVILQAALSLVLVTVAGLLTQSLRNLDRQAFGFEADGRLIVEVDPQSAGYTQGQLTELSRRIDDRLSQVPGVISESQSLYTVQQGSTLWGARVFIEGGAGPFVSAWDRVGPRYFETIGTPLVRGRSVDEHDTADSTHVAVINETFARSFFPNQDPIGHHFGKYEVGHSHEFEVVGVVKDAKYVDALRAVRPMFFVPMLQTIRYSGAIQNTIEESSRYVGSIVLHVQGDPDAMQPAVRAALARVDPNLPPMRMTSLPELIRIGTSERTLIARLSDAFGGIALLLAAVGLYGVTAYRVARRRHEIGLRMVLGATRGDIAGLIIRGACSYTGIGLLIGLPLAVLAAKGLEHELFGVSAFNVPVLVLGAVVVGGCALLASALPARRAAGLAPMEALRRE